MARILIAGCGYVGTRLALDLSRRGHEVLALRRDPSRLPEGIDAVAIDLRGRDLAAALSGTYDYVFFTAASDEASEASYRGIYLDGLGNLINALTARKPRPRRLLYTSSSAVYGQADGGWVDEDSPASADYFQGRVLVESEALARQAPFPATVVRFSGIYGPERASLIKRLRRGELRVAARTAWTNRIHRDDCAGVLAHLMSLGEPEPLYLASDDEPAEWRAVVAWLAERIGVPCPTPEPGAWAPRSSKRCSNARLRRSGYRFRYPTFREGYSAMLEQRGEGAPRSEDPR